MHRQVKTQAIPCDEANLALWAITIAILVCTLTVL